MRYYLLDPNDHAVTGPFELDEVEAKLKAGELSAGTLATGDIGEGLARIRHAPPEDWFPVESIRGLGEERPRGSQLPPPLPLPKLTNAPPSLSSAMVFCPACGHKLALDAGSVCDRCGKGLVVVIREPAKPPECEPDALLPKAAVAAGGEWLGVVGAILMVLSALFLIGFFLFLNLMSNCKA